MTITGTTSLFIVRKINSEWYVNINFQHLIELKKLSEISFYKHPTSNDTIQLTPRNSQSSIVLAMDYITAMSCIEGLLSKYLNSEDICNDAIGGSISVLVKDRNGEYIAMTREFSSDIDLSPVHMRCLGYMIDNLFVDVKNIGEIHVKLQEVISFIEDPSEISLGVK